MASLIGTTGKDTLMGGAGADSLRGGAGADLFVLQGVAGVQSTLAAPDRIADFKASEGDLLALRAQPIGGSVDPILTGTWGLPGQTPLPVGWGGALAPVAGLATGLALPNPTGGAGLLLYWLPDAASGGWLVLDGNRNGVLGAGDLVVRLDLPAGTAIGAGAFLPGTFSLLGTKGADTVSGTGADERMQGFAGHDSLSGGAGRDTLAGGAGNDTLSGGAGFDSLDGGNDDDSLAGGDGQDVLVGGAGRDRLSGDAADDLLQGGGNHDSLSGGSGDDSLEGGSGADTLAGGAGADTILVQAMREAAWSTLSGQDLLVDFTAAEGDRLRLSDAWTGTGDGSGADAGTYTGTDGVARVLVWGGVTRPLASLTTGTRLPAQPLGATEAYQVHWVPAVTGAGLPAGGWLVLDLDRDGRVGGADLVARIGSAAQPVTLAPEDFVAGTFLSVLRPGVQRAGSAGNDTLPGGSLSEAFLGSAGSDLLQGGAGAANALSYAALSGSIRLRLTGHGSGTVVKSAGGTDTVSGIHAFTGTAGADRFEAGAAGSGLFATTLEGLAGNDTLAGNYGGGVQVSYRASPAAVRVDLAAGTARDGWGGTDRLLNIRRVLVASDFNDTVLGSAGTDLFLSGSGGSKSFDGRAGTDEWRYAGTGSVTVNLAAGTARKPGGTDRLVAIEAAAGGAGDDSLLGGAGNDQLAGAAGNDTLDGGAGHDVARYDVIAAGSDLPLRGAVVDLSAGVATDPWGGRDLLRSIESAWGSRLADDLTGIALSGTTTLRGLAGDDTLRGPRAGSRVMADYAGDPAAVVVDLAAGTAQDGWGGTDRLWMIDHARGTSYADSLAGNAAANLLQGGAGNDTLAGGAGGDALEGQDGADLLAGGEGNDTLRGGAGDDTLSGDAGNDTLQPGLGADRVQGGAGDDLFQPEADGRFTGSITLTLGDGTQRTIASSSAATFTDTLDGGAGLDRWLSPGGTVLLDLRSLPAQATGIERFEGGSGADVLILSPTMTQAVTLLGGAGNDTLSAGAGGDLLEGQDGNDLLAGQGGNDTLRGGAGNDSLLGGAGNDSLDGQAGRDTLRGGDGNDTLASADWASWLDGGAGSDLLLLSRASSTRALRLDTVTGGMAITDGTSTTQLRSFQWASVQGGAGADSLLGLSGNDTLRGGAGNDTLSGAAGNDLLDGQDGNDRLAGQDGNDVLRGGAGNDTLWGDAGNDSLDGQAGRDSLSGGAGNDTLTSSDWATLLDGGSGTDLLSLSRATSTRALRMATVAGGMAITDGVSTTQLRGFEWASVQGGAGADSLLGLSGNDTLRGGAGSDTLSGMAGKDLLAGQDSNDLLRGGMGNDMLDGGAGSDVALFTATRASTVLTRQTDGSWLAVGPEGVDRLVSIELARFTDSDVVLR
ncbi:calcium-binding protein [Roseicella aquatilis]|nr:calcium-binding protein [Roseicella aquatilis]